MIARGIEDTATKAEDRGQEINSREKEVKGEEKKPMEEEREKRRKKHIMAVVNQKSDKLTVGMVPGSSFKC